jgi:hypothetical protein
MRNGKLAMDKVITWTDITQQSWQPEMVMAYSLGDALAVLFLVWATISVFAWPVAVFFKLQDVTREVNQLRGSIVLLCQAVQDLIGEDDDPDGGEEPEEEPSNVVAIGRKAS